MPLPKVAPIIIAALPIPDNLTADQLFEYGKKILFGLLDRHIHVVSYACDGTEVERSVQRLYIQAADRVMRYTIKSPNKGLPDIELVIGIFRGVPIVMVQDSKHGLKTFRNNLFSGARLLSFGNFTAMYRRICELAHEEGTPLYHRDVHKMDRQDDLAAARLFSGATMKFLTEHHPEYLGEIVYLFVFGELIDAYQNRNISHPERIKMALRARYFVGYWRGYLSAAGYSETQYFISREATDILQYLIDGLVSLVLVYRDHYKSEFPFFPWLHSSETCEHVFGEARQVVKDFTMLDFYYMLTKLRVKLREAAFHDKSPNFKAHANGYCHTYYDGKGAKALLMATFPTDAEIEDVALQALEECESLISLLGLRPSVLQDRMANRAPDVTLPNIASWYPDGDLDEFEAQDNDSDYNDDGDESENEAEVLQALMDRAEKNNLPTTEKQDEQLTRLACAAVAITNDDMARM